MMAEMSDVEKLLRDIQTLRESIQLLHLERVHTTTPAGRQSLRLQIDLLQRELLNLLLELDQSGSE